MKFKINNNLLESVVKAEAKQLKKELVGKTDKKARLNQLNERRKNIQAQLNEMYDEGELDEIFGASKFKKAKKEFKDMNANELDAMMKAYKAKDLSYIELSQSLLQKAQTAIPQLAQKYGIDDMSDMKVLRGDIMDMVQPMNYDVFKRQAQGGTSFRDFAAGASTGAKDFGMGE